ncbi:hypothetical protein HWV62_686 [Athelia sp. TMB]|nr:hypothetical protein HWV62_686 [Athelia sp. TMB]
MARGHYTPTDRIDPAADAALLELLTGPAPPSPLALKKTKPKAKAFARRDEALDPLMLAAATASGPHATRNHYTHDFFPGVAVPQAEGAWDWTRWQGEPAKREKGRLAYVSRQAPRSKREKEGLAARPRRLSTASPAAETPSTGLLDAPVRGTEVVVKCMARTRIPTPHGPAFLHLYHNNRDRKEHLALVVDPAQLTPGPQLAPHIRSASLDAVWGEKETEMERITRGAYVGRLSAAAHAASAPHTPHPHAPELEAEAESDAPAPLVRIHSECFTGETVGSLRCDCGEQLDEAIRRISLPSPTSTPPRGAVVYLRQEGRGIGLLSKLRAYNLQDLGHDTVTANLMLGHGADERGYEVAGAILRDLGLGRVRLLTNNPDKVRALEGEGVRIAERVPMVPRSWQAREDEGKEKGDGDVERATVQQKERKAGATLIGGDAVHGEDLEKYLRTKVLRMGHMLPLYLGDHV